VACCEDGWWCGTLALDGHESSASYPGLFYPKGKIHGTHRTAVIAQSLLQLGCGQDNQKTRHRHRYFEE